MPYTATTIDLCETTWNELGTAGVVLSTDGADYKEGSNSTVMTMAAPLAAGTIIATEDISALTPDLSGCHRVRLWIKSSVDTAAGDLQLLLDAHANCASPEETLDIPALTAATWAYVTVSLADPASDGAIISVGLKYTLNPQAGAIKVDAVYGDAMTPEFQKREIARLSSQAFSQFEEIVSRMTEYAADTGTAAGTHSNTTLQDTGKSWEVNRWKDAIVEIHVASDGLSHYSTVISNTANTLTFGALAGAVSPADGDDYAIRLSWRKVVTVTEDQDGQTPVGVNVTTSTTAILAANADRKAAIICNDSDAVMWLAVGQNAVAHQGIRLNAAGGTLVISQNGDIFSTEAVNGIHAATGNKVATAQELE